MVSRAERENPHLLLGITGSIAAYLTPSWAADFRRNGFEIKTILSRGGAEFVTRAALEAMSRSEVYTDNDRMIDHRPAHIVLAEWADIALVAPASAETISNLAQGRANSLLGETMLALSRAIKTRRYIAPAMNVAMYEDPATQANLGRLREYGYTEIPPRNGELACGHIGIGKVASSGVMVATMLEAVSLHTTDVPQR